MTSHLSVAPTFALVMAFGLPTLAPPAVAQEAPGFNMEWTSNDGTVTYDWNTFGTLHEFGTYQVPGDSQDWTGWKYDGGLVGLGWEVDWNAVFNDTNGGLTAGGAFVTANIVVTNNDIVNQNFSLLMTLPTGALGAATERGSVVGTVTDLTSDDAMVLAPAGSRIYTPMIDGTPEAPGFLMTDPFSQAAGGAFQSATVGPADFGIPAPVATSQAIDASIGILLDFDLTPGDSASFTAIFEVIIPAPAGLPVLAALGLMAGRRRRR